MSHNPVDVDRSTDAALEKHERKLSMTNARLADKRAEVLVQMSALLADVGLETMDERLKEELRSRALTRMTAYVRSKEFDALVGLRVTEYVEDLVAERLGERVTELESRVKIIVDERFEAAVQKAAEERLAKILGEVRSRFAR